MQYTEFIHPEDAAALKALKAIPMLSTIVKKVMDVGAEQLQTGLNMASKVKLSPTQLPRLYNILPPICERLEIKEPEFYLEMNPAPNAYAFGDTQTAITITSALVDMMSEDELIGVVAHECGHIACRHMLYHTLAQVIANASGMFETLAKLAVPIHYALMYWQRKSELSCDRAAAYMVGPKATASMLARLAGGPKSITSELNLEELAIPIPTLIGQKAWREERVNNINAAIKALVVAINAERDKQNEGVRKSINKTYTYYMQNLNKQIEENKSLRAENDALKTENNKVKQRISQLDEKAVERVTTQLVCAKEELASAKSYNTTLLEMYNDLKARWNAIWQEPEMIDAWRRVEVRKKEDAKEKARQEAEAKRESIARQNRYIGVLDKFIHEGHEALSSFAKTDRVNFNEKESASIYYGIMASAVKHNIGLDSKACIESATKRFLSDMSWHGFTDFKQECVTSWTKLFATNEVQFTDKAIDNFLAFVDHMSCSADTYVSLGGSNGCADQLTNWDGTQKIGLGAINNKPYRSSRR